MCLFCDIVEGKAPSHKVYEDEHTYAFLDIRPVANGHVLVIPKIHKVMLEELTEDEYHNLFETVRILIDPIQRAMKAPSSNIGVNNGSASGQIIPHIHVHIIPRTSRTDRFIGNISRAKPRSKNYFIETAEKIRKEIEASL